MAMAVPTPRDLWAAPELAVLAILDAALAAAAEVLFAYHPGLHDLAGTYQGRAPPLCGALAAILVSRFEELRDLLAWYRLAVQSPPSDDDFPF